MRKSAKSKFDHNLSIQTFTIKEDSVSSNQTRI